MFDCDGVLADSEPVSFVAWAAAIAEFGHALTADEFAHSIGTTDRQVAETWAPRLRATTEDLERLAREAFLDGVRSVEVFSDAVALRNRLDVPVGLGTNSERWRLDAILAATGLGPRFPVSVTSTEAAAKPAPDIYREAFRILGVHPASGLVIEDSPAGIRAARAAGAVVVAVDRGQLDTVKLAGADLIVDRLA